MVDSCSSDRQNAKKGPSRRRMDQGKQQGKQQGIGKRDENLRAKDASAEPNRCLRLRASLPSTLDGTCKSLDSRTGDTIDQQMGQHLMPIRLVMKWVV